MPRVSRFLYPAASQIARDTPNRSRRRRSVATPRTPQTPVERRPPAAPDPSLTPAEQRDVQACLATAMETLEDDGDTFFTQCRVSAPTELSEIGTLGRKTAEWMEKTSQLQLSSDNVAPNCEFMGTGTAAARLVARANRPLSADLPKDSSNETVPYSALCCVPLKCGREASEFSSERRTPAGRPRDRLGRGQPTKRL